MTDKKFDEIVIDAIMSSNSRSLGSSSLPSMIAQLTSLSRMSVGIDRTPNSYIDKNLFYWDPEKVREQSMTDIQTQLVSNMKNVAEPDIETIAEDEYIERSTNYFKKKNTIISIGRNNLGIDFKKPTSILLEDCMATSIRSQFVGQSIYELGGRSVEIIPSLRYISATLVIRDGFMETEYSLQIGSIKDISKEKEKELPVKPTVQRRIIID